MVNRMHGKGQFLLIIYQSPFILCWVDFLSFINDLKQNPSMKSENILGELSHSFPVFTGYSADDNGQLFSA